MLKAARERVDKESGDMSIFDLAKATLVCGGTAFLIYSFPVVGQILVIGFLSLLWLLYAREAIHSLRRR